MARVSKLPDLTGVWRIARRISPAGRFQGVATIAPVDGILRYHETGTMALSGTHLDAYRDYIYQIDGDVLCVRHSDGKDFLTLHFIDGQARDSHVCGADEYRALYRFKSQNRLIVRYDVQGPRKNYRMVSCLTRQVT